MTDDLKNKNIFQNALQQFVDEKERHQSEGDLAKEGSKEMIVFNAKSCADLQEGEDVA